MLICRPEVVPQDDLVTMASPSRTRSPDLKVVGEALADDVRTATPPRGAAESRAASLPVADTGVASPPCAVEVGEGTSIGNYAMDCVAVPTEGEEAKSIVDRLIDTPKRLLTLLRATSLAAATDALVRVKSHYPDVDMAKVKAGPVVEKDLAALELEVQDAANEVMDKLDYEGGDDEA
jgi:hypothetical protein